MELTRFKEQVFSLGKQAGFSAMELYFQESEDMQIKVFRGEVDSFTLSQVGGLSFRGIYNDQVGYAYTEVFDEEAAAMLIRDAKENAQVLDDEDKAIIYPGSATYPEFDGYAPELARVSTEEKIQLAKALEAAALKQDKRVQAVNYCLVATGEDKVSIENTRGLKLAHHGNGAFCYLSVVVREGDDTKTFGRFASTRSFADLDADALAAQAVQEALGLLGADTLESGAYPVILRWEAAVTLLQAFAGIFSAENVQKNVSLLKGKLNSRIAAEDITIVDDPLLPQGIYSTPFDAEGVATRSKIVVGNGILNTYLHNLKTAAKDGVESTGNAVKRSYKSDVTVAPTNMYIKPGNKSLAEIVGGIDRGVMVVDLQGAHAGANPVSGDFSLAAMGYLVEGGKIVRPVNQITIAGNFVAMLKDVEAVGSDLNFGLPGGSQLGAPSLLVRELAVSGK